MTDAQALTAYLQAVRETHASGAAGPETSYYPALSQLLNEIGGTLKPKVRCVMNLKQQGNGMPDGGLFTADQLARRTVEAALLAGQLPARGAIEVKGAAADLDQLAVSGQVKGYLDTYGIVLITNLRQFAIVDRQGFRERYTLAATKDAFWNNTVAAPQATVAAHGAFFAEFLRRACLHDAPLTTPKDVAWFLASYARDALARVEAKKDLPALANVRTALEQALGMTFTGDDGEHFFRSTLVQTLFYGVFSAWVKWCDDAPAIAQPFDWRSAAWTLHVPFIRSLYGMIAQPNTLGPLGLVEPIDWAAAALNRVDRDAFFARFERSQAVQYFYEPFLEAYDPKLRKDLGVWYTPPEVVKYQVARVDRVLREELNLPDGLAHPDVVVLDPCCGTGAYLVEVLRTISATLKANGGDALSAADLKTAATTRVFGFEIMPAPFVVAHLQLGLLLEQEGAPLDVANDERVGVYLTNALTGWEPPATPQQQVLGQWAELQSEKDAATRIKRTRRILVVIGNPPYNGLANVAIAEERSLTTAYRTTVHAPRPEGQGLNDLYIRFFRMAERRIAEITGEGVICFISNYSWLDGRSHPGMREHYLNAFDKVWIDSLNGDKYKTGKRTPEGLPDPSIFSTPFNREGVQVGTAIATLVRTPRHESPATVMYRDFWGTGKLAELKLAGEATDQTGYTTFLPNLPLGLAFKPQGTTANYMTWPLLTDVLEQSFAGVKTNRDRSLVSIDLDPLRERITRYFDANTDESELVRLVPDLMQSDAQFNAAETRRVLLRRGLLESGFKQYYYRPFDVRWLYWEPDTKLLDRNRAEYVPNVTPRNLWIMLAQRTRRGFNPPVCTRHLLSCHVIESASSAFPLMQPMEEGAIGFDEAHSNFSTGAVAYIERSEATPATLFYHVLAVLHAPVYGEQNVDALTNDWPRIPLPATRAALEASAALGERVAALLDTEADVPGVTGGTIAPLLRTVGGIAKTAGGAIDPNGDDLALTVNWGYAGQANATMPGRGKTETRDFTAAERQAIAFEAAAAGLSGVPRSCTQGRAGAPDDTALGTRPWHPITPDALTALLGGRTLDVYLNGGVYWRNVPLAVWEFYIGGYQVMKKWLSYRERDLLGRPLKVDEVREVTAMARRLTALVLLRPRLDANYAAVAAHTYAWPAG